ncbi:LOW QUALITY PROTEIN: uncharacterized protein LOC144660966 [Oculina patagonica]
MLQHCDWLVFNCCDWCISILAVLVCCRSLNSPTCLNQDEASVPDEPEQNNRATLSHDSSLSAKIVSTVDDQTPDSKDTCLNVSVQPERAACLTTIAEADSSIRTSPCESTALCANKEPVPACVNTATNGKEDEGAVSSTKFDSCPLSSVDTMQSISILLSQDCHEQHCDVAPDNVHGEDQKKGARQDENADSQDIKEDALITTESFLVENQEEPLIACKERHTSDPSIDTRLPSESMPSGDKDPPTQSLDFDGLVAFFDEPSLTKPTETLQKADETEKELQQKKLSPVQKWRAHEDALDNEATESDLYERVKQRQRRRASEVSLQSNRLSDPPKKSLQLKTKTKKRSADSVVVLTHDEPSPNGNARKKFKQSRAPSHDEASPLTANTERSQDDRGLSRERKENVEDLHESSLPCVKGNDQVEDDASTLDSPSCSSGKTMLSNEMVPASVSASEKSISPVINPMIAHVNQALDGMQGGSTGNAEEWGSQTITKNDHGDIAKNRTVQKIGTNEESPQIKPVWDKGKLKSNEPTDKEKAFQYEESDTKITASAVSNSRQKPFMTPSQVNVSEQNRSPKGKEKESVHVEDAEGGGSSQVSVTRHHESQAFDSSEKELLTYCDQTSHFHEQKEEQRPGLGDIDDTQGLRREFTTLQASGTEQKHLSSSFSTCSEKEIVCEETGITDSQVDGKLSNGSVEAEGKTSGPGNTPTQCSLEVMDVVTPCLFGNDSWETSDRKTSQKKSGNQRSSSNASAPRSPSNIALSCGTVTEKGRIVDKVGLDGSQAEASRAELCPYGNNKEPASETDPEGTQSFGTSQSISVLQDLEFPPQEYHVEEDAACSEEKEDSKKSSQNVNTTTNRDASWVEPLPKKPRSANMVSSSHELHPNFSLEQGSGPSIEKTRDSECMESDVIPPTPPVKPVTKQVFSSRSPSRLSRSKMKLQRKDETNSHFERLVVKPKRRVKSPRVLKSTGSQDSEGDRAGTRYNSGSSETAEDSVSLLKNHTRSPEVLDAQTMDLSPASEPDSNKHLELSQDRNTETTCKGNKLENTPCKSPRGVTNFVKSVQKISDVSSENANDPGSLQEIDDINDSQKERHTVVTNSKETKSVDVVERPLREGHEEGANFAPCGSVKRKVYDIEDSFDWSGTKNGGKYNEGCQDGPETPYKGDNEDDQVKGDAEDDENGEELEDDILEKYEAENLHETGDRDCVLLDDDNRDFPCTNDKGDSTCTSDEEGSLSDEALLKPIFLPKETESSGDARSCKEDAENEEEEVAAFSQELIPSENEGEDDDDDGITSSYKALDSTGASSATFLSEAAASTQKMDVLRQDVEEMEREMEELRAYLAKTDEKRDDAENAIEEDDMEYQEEDPCDDPDMLPSLTPPPPLTPKSIPPMRQLSSPLKNVSRYLDQEGQSSDEDSDCGDITRTNQEKQCELRKSSSSEGNRSVAEKDDGNTRKRSLSPSYEDDGLSITAVENRQDKTPSPPRSLRLKQTAHEKDEKELIVIDDQDPAQSKTGSLWLVKRRRVADEIVPKKSPVVSLLFTRTRKDSPKPSQFTKPVEQTKVPSPIQKKSTPFIYSRKRGAEISPISGQDSPQPVTGDSVSRDTTSRERVPRDQCRSPKPELARLTVVTSAKTSKDKENKNCQRSGTTKHLSFVATRLNRKQLAEARALAETYGGKLASEFNNRTSHVIMTTDENMQVTRHSYTMKYLMGLALGKWIVSHYWIAACIQAKALVAEADYEVKGDSGLGQASIPRLARTARSDEEDTLLFEDFGVLCYGEFSAAVTKEQLSQLLKFCGASVYVDTEILKMMQKDRRKVVVIDKETRNNVDDINAICRQLNTKPVSLEWVTDSIANYKVQDFKDYIMEM